MNLQGAYLTYPQLPILKVKTSIQPRSSAAVPQLAHSHDPWEKGTPVESNHYNWSEKPIIRPPQRVEPATGMGMLDLFAGCGGFSAGFHMAGFQTLLANDIHPPSLDTYQVNNPGATVIVGDIRQVSEEMVADGLAGRQVDVITAGIPCQGFSLNNRKRHTEDDRNYLFEELIRVVAIVKPSVVLVENVSGLRSAGGGKFKSEISKALEKEGYNVQFTMLNAADYGVPQRRQRVFFLATLPDVDVRFPRPTHGPFGKLPHVTVWEAIGDLPQIVAGESADAYVGPPLTDFQRRMREGSELIQNHIAPLHPAETIEKIGSTIPGQPMYPKFKQRIRLHPDQTSPTQVSGGIRPQFQFGHPTLARGLTVRERCRLQSFPDRYHILGGVVQGRYQTGNAVPPLLAKAIADQIAAALHGETIDDREGMALQSGGNQMVLF